MLLKEFFVIETKTVKKTESGKYVIPNILLSQANAKNNNERAYPKPILERELGNYLKAIKERRAVGELDHPDKPIVELRNVSHIVTNAWWNGDAIKGDIEILPTPAGKILETLVRSGVKLGVSSRGVGSVKLDENQTQIVQDDYQLICWDIVSEPSTQGAYLTEHKGFDPRSIEVVDGTIEREKRIKEILDVILKKE